MITLNVFTDENIIQDAIRRCHVTDCIVNNYKSYANINFILERKTKEKKSIFKVL